MRSLGELIPMENSFKDKALGHANTQTWGGESSKANHELLGRGESRGRVYYKKANKQQTGQFVA